MQFTTGEWVSFQHKLGFVLVKDEKKQKCLVQFHLRGEVDMHWVPVQLLESREDIRLTEEDIGELQVMAIKIEDGQWFMELEKLMYK